MGVLLGLFSWCGTGGGGGSCIGDVKGVSMGEVEGLALGVADGVVVKIQPLVIW